MIASKLLSSVIRLVLLLLLAVFLYFPDAFTIRFTYPVDSLFDNVYIRLAKGCILLLLTIELLRIYYYGIVKNQAAPKVLGNVVTLGIFMLVLGVGLEITFMFIAQSHEGNSTLASRIWFERYWSPMNEKGYRDAGYEDSTSNKRKVILIGDSFAAGHGIKQADERFGNILGEKLGKNYRVYNLGVSGSDTRDEYRRLEEFTIKPDAVVLEYFPNDIEKAASERGVVPKGAPMFSDIPGPLRRFFLKSYLLNFIYFQLPHGDFAPYRDYAQRVYGDTAILNTHIRDLKKIVDYSRRNNAKMYVVIFPFSHNFEASKVYTQPVEAFFKQQQIPILRVSDYIQDVEPGDRIVGKNDAHASPLVNKRVGDALHRMVATDLQLATGK